MDTIVSVLNLFTPAIIFAILTLAGVVAFFVYYWRAVLPRRGTLEWVVRAASSPRRFTFRLHRYPMARKDILPLLTITAVYAATAFFRLGDVSAPQSFVSFQQGDVGYFSFSQVEEVRVRYYTGIATGTYLLEYSQDGSTWEQVELTQAYDQLLKWQEITTTDEEGNTVPLVISAKLLRISATTRNDANHPERNFLDLGELALVGADGEPLTPSYVGDSMTALFDEQSLVPDYETYMNSSYFDEIYHVRTAQEHIDDIYPYEVSHPPLGKLIISLGIRMFGLTPFGWRFMGTLFGVAMLPLLYIFLKNFFGRTAVAACGTILFAVDFMHLVQTRIATIDTYGVFFILAMYYFLYRWITVPPNTRLRRSLLPLFLSGLMFGIGVASKWTVIYGGVGLAIVYAVNLVCKYRSWSREAGVPRFAPWLIGTLLWSVVFFIAIPAAIYVASYIPYAVADGDTSWQNLLRIVVDNQEFMFTYHSGVDTPHPYSSRWYQWIVDGRPILYYREQDMLASQGLKSAFSSFNNPLVSWAGLLCIILTGIETVRRRSGRALFILVGYLSQLVPWMFITRITFAYHYFPSMLFLVMAISYAMNQILRRRRREGKKAVYGLTAGATALYAAFYPVLIGLYVPVFYTWNFLRWLPSWPI